MTYNLDSIVFDNNFYVLDIGGGNTVIFNLVEEDIAVGSEVTEISGVNTAVVDSEGVYHTSVNVIGLSDNFYSLNTEHTEYLGKSLTSENIKYCTLEVKDV